MNPGRFDDRSSIGSHLSRKRFGDFARVVTLEMAAQALDLALLGRGLFLALQRYSSLLPLYDERPMDALYVP